MAEQKPTDVSYGSDDLFELHVITGLRAMLGDGKARQAMEKVKGQSSGAFELAMAEAETRYQVPCSFGGGQGEPSQGAQPTRS